MSKNIIKTKMADEEIEETIQKEVLAKYKYSGIKNLNDNEVYNIVRNVSSITHLHERIVLGCYICVRYIMLILKGIYNNIAYELLKKNIITSLAKTNSSYIIGY